MQVSGEQSDFDEAKLKDIEIKIPNGNDGSWAGIKYFFKLLLYKFYRLL